MATPSFASGGRVPAGIGPQLAADGGIGDHETNGVGDLLGPDQSPQLGEGKDVLHDELLPQGPYHRRIGEAGMDDGATHAVKDRLLHQRGGGPLQAGLARRVGNLSLVSLRGNRADKYDHAQLPLARLPASQSAATPVLG